MTTGPKTTLTLSRKTATSDGMGGQSFAWSDVKELTGVFSVLSDRERIMYGKKAEFATYKFVLDHMFAGVATTRDRLENGGRVFEVVSKENPMEQNRFVILLLTEFVNG